MPIDWDEHDRVAPALRGPTGVILFIGAVGLFGLSIYHLVVQEPLGFVVMPLIIGTGWLGGAVFYWKRRQRRSIS